MNPRPDHARLPCENGDPVVDCSGDEFLRLAFESALDQSLDEVVGSGNDNYLVNVAAVLSPVAGAAAVMDTHAYANPHQGSIQHGEGPIAVARSGQRRCDQSDRDGEREPLDEFLHGSS
ncbi:MAG: hypothetical protein A3H72_01115 [Candidatus Doudnabacteria bacterium RIFCSPLOWO2_02_FULL_48_8]|nr:MAG: hypothetical protein A3H72_01115 [Candidatus Doudnabacteria bacterium RIFCSPLOWO2_02_FULL_48_8]